MYKSSIFVIRRVNIIRRRHNSLEFIDEMKKLTAVVKVVNEVLMMDECSNFKNVTLIELFQNVLFRFVVIRGRGMTIDLLLVNVILVLFM